MKRLIATIILATIVMVIAGCDITYEHYGHHGHHGHGPGPIIVSRRVYAPPPHWRGPHGHGPGRNWRRH